MHGYTSHGHACCDQAPEPLPVLVARCGGPGICTVCATENRLLHPITASELPRPKSYEGCCRAAVDSDGHAHDHAQWYSDLVKAEAERDALAYLLRRVMDEPIKITHGTRITLPEVPGIVFVEASLWTHGDERAELYLVEENEWRARRIANGLPPGRSAPAE